MKNRYAAVLWVASLLPFVAMPAVGQEASSADRARAHVDDRSGGDVLRPRRLATGGKKRGGIFRHCESFGGAFRPEAWACFAR